MPDDLTPETPNMSGDFASIKDPAPPQPSPLAPSPPEQQAGITTVAELDMREKHTQTPKLETHLTIGGQTEQIVHEKTFDENEARKSYLESRLDHAGQKLHRDFERGR